MPKRLILEAILVVRDGVRIKPEIGKVFNLEQSEIDDVMSVRPQALGEVAGEVEDRRGAKVKTDDNADDSANGQSGDEPEAPAAKAPAAKAPAAKKGAKAAPKAADTGGDEDL